jgi:hypothetical protein
VLPEVVLWLSATAHLQLVWIGQRRSGLNLNLHSTDMRDRVPSLTRLLDPS